MHKKLLYISKIKNRRSSILYTELSETGSPYSPSRIVRPKAEIF
jgi:hypothetical protein